MPAKEEEETNRPTGPAKFKEKSITKKKNRRPAKILDRRPHPPVLVQRKNELRF